MAKALSSTPIAHQRYTFIVLEEMRDWLTPYIGGPCSLLGVPASSVSAAKVALRHIAPLRFLWQRVRTGISHLPKSDGLIEAQKFDVVHFPTQTAYLTDVPSIYQPWDLQHCHLPQFFTQNDLDIRDRQYRAFCDQARFVCVQTEWTRKDVIDKLGVAPEKLILIPWGCVFDAYAPVSEQAIRDTVSKFALPERFFIYPAKTWPHKNHELILRALHRLRLEGGEVPDVYFTGSSTPYRATLDRLTAELGIRERVHFTGFLSPAELQAFFLRATAMIFPSRFEGFGLPLLEAFHAGTPVLASSATVLPEVAQGGALFFDPDTPEQLAALMSRVNNEPELRQDLVARGKVVLSHSSMKNTVTALQNLYDRAASI